MVRNKLYTDKSMHYFNTKNRRTLEKTERTVAKFNTDFTLNPAIFYLVLLKTQFFYLVHQILTLLLAHVITRSLY